MVVALAVGPVQKPVLVCPRCPPRVASTSISYSDASRDFDLGAVPLLPATREVYWFRTRVPPGGAAGVKEEPMVDALFGPFLAEQGCVDEVSFVDSNASLAWICRGRARSRDGRPRLDVDPMLSGMWLQTAIRGGVQMV